MKKKLKIFTLLLCVLFLSTCNSTTSSTIMNHVDLYRSYDSGGSHLLHIDNKLVFLGLPFVPHEDINPTYIDLNECDLNGKLLLSKQLKLSKGYIPYNDVKIASNSRNLFMAYTYRLSDNESLFIAKLEKNYTVVWTKLLKHTDHHMNISRISANELGDLFLSGECFDPSNDTTKCYTIQIDDKERIKYQDEMFIKSPSFKPDALNLRSTVVDDSGNLFFVGWTFSIGNSNWENALGFLGKINSSGKLEYLKGISKSKQTGITQFREVYLMPNNHLLIMGSDGFNGIFFFEFNREGEFIRAINLIGSQSKFIIPEVLLHNENILLAQIIDGAKEDDFDEFTLISLLWDSKNPVIINSKQSYLGLATLYEDYILEPYQKGETSFYSMYQTKQLQILLLGFTSSGELVTSGIKKKVVELPLKCIDVSKEIMAEDWLLNGNIVRKKMNFESKNIENLLTCINYP